MKNTKHYNRRRRKQRIKKWITLGSIIAVIAIIIIILLVARKNKNTAPENVSNDINSASTAIAAESQPQSTEVPTISEYDKVLAKISINCTKDKPQLIDPAKWNENAANIMENFSTKNHYNINVKSGFPYLITVNRAASTVTVYSADDNGKYTIPYMAMVCSGGTDTPNGSFNTIISYNWRELFGPCFGQYATRIYDSYLFHSVPYYSKHKDDLEYDEYNKLGTIASLGCIRLMTVDVKWIYDNCPIGTPVIMYDDEANPGPMGKPGTIYIDPDNETLRGWDPTDPDPANPWDDKYLTGTTIRSDAAWAEYNDAQSLGKWNTSINTTDLQGHSTDSKIEGTRG